MTVLLGYIDRCTALNTIMLVIFHYAVTNVRATVVTSRSIQITWELSSSSDGVTGYLISYTTTASYTSGGIVHVMVHGGSTTSDTLTNLEEDTLYIITVQATTSNNRKSVNSNEVSVRT